MSGERHFDHQLNAMEVRLASLDERLRRVENGVARIEGSLNGGRAVAGDNRSNTAIMIAAISVVVSIVGLIIGYAIGVG